MRKIITLLCAGTSVLAMDPAAFAQEAPPAPGSQDVSQTRQTEETVAASNDIVVTARRREETVQNVPQVVNAVTGDSIQKLNLRRFEDLTAVVPGLQLRANANGIGAVTTIRGVNFDVNQSGNNGTVQFYFNDAPLSAGVLYQALFDVGQVSVERGPQGTLRGRATPSGSINFAMRRPDMTEVGGYLSGTVTDLKGYNVNGALNIPLLAGKLAVRLAGVKSEDQGNRVRYYAPGAENPDNDAKSGRVSVRADPFDGKFIVQYTYQATERDSVQFDPVQSMSLFPATATTAASPVTIRAEDRLAVNAMPQRFHQNFFIYNWNAELNLAGQKLSYIRLRLKQNLVSTGSADNAGIFGLNALQTVPGVAFNNTTCPFTAANPVPATCYPLGNRVLGQPTNPTLSNDLSQEIRLQNNERIAGLLDYVVGYLRYAGGSNTLFDSVVTARAAVRPTTTAQLPGTLARVDFSPNLRFAKFKEESVFGNIALHVGNAELSGGVRHIWYSADSGLSTFNTTSQTYVENPLLHVTDKSEATIYIASAKYNFSRDLMAYVSYGTSWRPQTVVIGGPNQPTAFQNSFLHTVPETSRNWEAGFKSTWLDGRGNLNLSAYWQKYKNYPYRTGSVFYFNQQTSGISSTAFVTGADVQVKGFEVEASLRPIANWSIGGIVSYADGHLKNAVVPCNTIPGTTTPTVSQFQAAGLINRPTTNEPGLGTCISNQRSSSASPWSASLQSEFKQPFSPAMEGFVRGLFSWQGNSINDPNNPFDDVRSYGILNLYLGVRDPKGAWEVTAYGKNLTNTFRVLNRGATALSTNINLTPTSFTNYFGIGTTDPREFGLTARFAFGSR
ncbi:MAG: TonB-dependent receptor [Novosphingobium sp.]|nr:TonB-dependent receptor [Novosphingobium sp.]